MGRGSTTRPGRTGQAVSPRIRFEPEADAEYRRAGRWYESQRTGLGLEFLDAVDAAIRRIADWPQSGSPAPRVPAELPVRRIAVKRFPYHVVYLPTRNTIRILAIAHDRRKPGYWGSREK
jgi:plasmid stabilization system protein ParE